MKSKMLDYSLETHVMVFGIVESYKASYIWDK